jgi:hypothetical protein
MEDDDNERGNEPVSPLFGMRNRNLTRRTREFPDLPLRTIPSSKPTLTVPAGHYTGETLKSYTPSSQNREPRGPEQQEVTLGLDQGNLRTPTRASRSAPSRPRLKVDVIPEEHGKLLPHSPVASLTLKMRQGILPELQCPCSNPQLQGSVQ